MNIKTRDQFADLLHHLRTHEVMAFDSETNGLSLYKGDAPISFSFYFPADEASFNFAFAHGIGSIFIPDENQDTRNFHKWKWTGKGKKQVYKSYWFEQYKRNTDYGNCPREWLDELRSVWNKHVVPDMLVVYFNEPFDVHMSESIGMQQPKHTEDVRIAVAIAFEDWRHPSIRGNNGLKWQANHWGIPGALLGEHELEEKAQQLTLKVATYVSEHWDDPMNSSYHILKRPARVDEIVKRVEFDDKAELWCLPSDDVAEYAENDTRITWLLREKLLHHLEQWNQIQLYVDWCAVQSEFLIRMERGGMAFDKEVAEGLVEELAPIMVDVNQWFVDRIETIWADITDDERDSLRDVKGRLSFTCGSPVKLRVVLTLLTGYTWESTDKNAMRLFEEQVGDSTPLDMLKKYRHAQRAVSTYLRNWIASVDENGYIHGSYNASGTKTGRLSSSSGTLGKVGNNQNIPSRGFNVKTAIITPPHFKLFQVDYSQLELRLSSWVADCKTMIQMFENNTDLHAYTRDMVHVQEILFPGMSALEAAAIAFAGNKLKCDGVPTTVKEAQHELDVYCRFVAKTLNFGLLYGGTWRMVNRLLHVGEAAARELHSQWNSLYPEFSDANRYWSALGLTRRPRPNGTGSVLYVQQPISGRTRKLGLYPVEETIYVTEKGKTRTVYIRTRESQAKDDFNFIVQGLGGYMMGMSGLRLCRAYPDEIFHPIAEVHDSVVFYLHEDALDIIPDIIHTICNWDVTPRLGADIEVSTDGTWQNFHHINDIELYTSSAGKQDKNEKGELICL